MGASIHTKAEELFFQASSNEPGVAWCKSTYDQEVAKIESLLTRCIAESPEHIGTAVIMYNGQMLPFNLSQYCNVSPP